MNIAESLVKTIERDGIVLKDRADTYNAIDRAILGGTFLFIKHNNKNIGFFTFEFDGVSKEILIENLFIYKEDRGIFNLLSLRNIFRSLYSEIGAFRWKSRKRNKPVKFNEKRMALC